MKQPAVTRVMVGLSGGVDSAVAALQLLEQGYQVEGLFMKNWDEDDADGYCPAAEDLADAEAVAARIGITLHKVNFSAEYWDRVFEYFLAEYRAGRTPNPDVLCNREIKFRAFLDHALSLGADAIATGHYARIAHAPDGVRLLKGLDPNKDQSYFLYLLSQSQLSRSLFPLGGLEKTRVRERAREAGFTNHAKKDSTGICFIGERRFNAFLKQYLPARPGEIVDPDGRVLGEHQGLMYHTIGQRQGLGIGGRADASGEPWYVADKDLEHNRLIVVQGSGHPLLLHRGLTLTRLHWIQGEPPAQPLTCSARIRYRQSDQPCVLEPLDGSRWQVGFDTPQRAITPGQAVVFYQGEVCLGGGTIEDRL
ncbi:tRNA 2-thiouridine(34) synthase MnmA [Thiohalobacter thiocyanaticus]|uniref:tRNA-specific 2-thiouridylase MnmA n=1 Tax=Thiohalobacter thiocyanaticus TaxID=585455 RepID=A0A426QE03_9GAMM|nr:tRNA 2-thiouridine(34) synthase MnmA [Thiohalobacter thiocyanaticus]RRQ19990.1 tRNA 2-thiouridine(34) synthase MnmA [Thiohalobacter thiocyanaticus]